MTSAVSIASSSRSPVHQKVSHARGYSKSTMERCEYHELYDIKKNPLILPVTFTLGKLDAGMVSFTVTELMLFLGYPARPQRSFARVPFLASPYPLKRATTPRSWVHSHHYCLSRPGCGTTSSRRFQRLAIRNLVHVFGDSIPTSVKITKCDSNERLRGMGRIGTWKLHV